jgi:hypothetical protein
MHVNIQSISLSTDAGIFHGQVCIETTPFWKNDQ